VTLPDDPSEDGAMDAVWDKLGRPEAPDSYTNALGDEHADDVFKGAASKAHELGLTDKQFAGMQEWFGEAAQGLEAQRKEQIDTTYNDWAAKNPEAVNNVQRLTQAVGVSAEQMDAALDGDKASLFDMLGKVASRMSEGKAVEGDGGADFTMSPQAAKQRVEQLWADPEFVKGYNDPNPKVRRPFIDKMERFQKAASGQK